MGEIVAVIIVTIVFVGIPAFFITILRGRKKESERRQKRVFNGMRNAAISMLIFIFGSIALMVIWLIIPPSLPRDRFDREKWISIERFDKNERYKMSRDIVKSKILIGKTKEGVVYLLGKDDIIQCDGSKIIYYTGARANFMTSNPQSLEIYFEDGQVVNVTVNKTGQNEIREKRREKCTSTS